MKKRFIFLVGVEVDEVANEQDVKDYIETAVNGWNGGYDTDHPLWDAKCFTIKNAARSLRQCSQKGTKVPFSSEK